MNMKFNLIENIIQEDNLHELAYKYNVGFMEMARFYKEASPKEIKKMEKFVKANDWEAFKKLIKKVIGVELKG